MKKIIAAIAAGFVALALSACGTAGTTASTSTAAVPSAATILANLQTVIVNGCSVVEPTLQSVAALDATVSAAATANGLFCTTASAITVTSAQTLINTGIPAVIAAVNASTFIAADQKPIIIAALGVFQLTVANALMVYDNAAAAAAPASAPVVAPDPASGAVA